MKIQHGQNKVGKYAFRIINDQGKAILVSSQYDDHVEMLTEIHKFVRGMERIELEQVKITEE